MKQRIVLDTNVYVSRLLREQSIPGQAVRRAWQEAITLVSIDTLAELREVLMRQKFARYIRREQVDPYIAQIWSLGLQVVDPPAIRACRDPKDDKFLEVAVHGRADAIVTGDADLLDLNPFRGIAILTPREYLEQEEPSSPTGYS
jgi:putative PIN family toxin of toxin-antitoxin system